MVLTKMSKQLGSPNLQKLIERTPQSKPKIGTYIVV
jgi:hypothetical protein